MDKYTKDIFHSNHILYHIAHNLNLKELDFELISDVSNFVYRFKKSNDNFILRITPSTRRTTKQIEGELDWLEYLARKKVNVCFPISLEDQHIISKIECGELYFSYVVFKKCEGIHWKINDWNPKLFFLWGKTMGQIHRISKGYSTTNTSIERPNWQEEAQKNTEKFLSPQDIIILKIFRDTMKQILSFPRNKDNYGLLHGDFHAGNFFLHNGEIIVFDFDNSIYSWFIFDIAVVLFEIQYMNGKNNVNFLIKKFMECFCAGYMDENNLESNWKEKLPLFLKLQEIHIFASILRNFDLNNLTGLEKIFMEDRKKSIELGQPYIDLRVIQGLK